MKNIDERRKQQQKTAAAEEKRIESENETERGSVMAWRRK